jgi:hypothetical protein
MSCGADIRYGESVYEFFFFGKPSFKEDRPYLTMFWS